MEDLEKSIKYMKDKIKRDSKKLYELDVKIKSAEEIYNNSKTLNNQINLVMLKNDKTNLKAELFLMKDNLEVLEQRLLSEQQSQPQ